MNELNPKLPKKLEEALEKYHAAPEPSADFAKRLELELRRKVKQTQPEIKTHVRTTFMTTLRARPALAILIALLILLALSGVAYAIGSLLGYIPGVGVVEQSQTILVLAEPMTIQREGVTLTVEQAVSTAEKTTVVYRHVEQPWIRADYYSSADDRPAIILPDGSKLDVLVAGRKPSDGAGILYALDFPPLPSGVTEVTLELTRLAGMHPGEGPENWEIPIRFKVGDPSQIVIYPVVEYDPTPTTANSAGTAGQSAQPAYGISITLDKAVDLPDGYILFGSSQWTDTSIHQYYMTFGLLSIKDANGQEIEYEFAENDLYPQPDERRQYWAYKITTKNFAPPLNLAFYVQLRENADAKFQFEPGPNPKDGQTWDLNIDVPVNGHVVKVVSARYKEYPANKSLEFTMTSDTNVMYAEVISFPRPLFGGGGGGGGVPQTNIPITSGFSFEGKIPDGPMTLMINALDVLVPGDWTITWTPPITTTSLSPTAPPPVHTEACLNKDSWQQALNKNEPIPSDLIGALVLANPNGEISTFDFASGERSVIGHGDAPSISPDGSRIVVEGSPINPQPPEGLYIIDLASGASTYLPGTTPTDGNPRWSPDGTKIAFTRRPAGSMDESDPTAIMVVKPDGSDLRQLTPFDGVRIVTAWMPDSIHIVYIARYGITNGSASLLNIATGGVSEMFRIDYGYGSVDISPDGKQAVYENWLPGEVYAIFASSIDGINQSLLAQGPETTVVIPKWSPDGHWIIATVYEGNSDGMLALIQVDTCKIVPLPEFTGYVGSWLP